MNRRYLLAASVALLICSLSAQIAAAPLGTSKREPIESIAARNRPHKTDELVRADDLSAWIPGAVVAFYAQPVAYATPSPQDRDIVGYLLVPSENRQFQRVLIDSYGPEGANAEIVGVSLKRRTPKLDRVLAIRVIWQNVHGALSQECSYLSPELSSLPEKLSRVKNKRCGISD